MQPAQAEGGGSSSNNLKKWGPIGAIVLVVAVIAGLVIFSGGDDDDDSTTDATTPATEPTGTDAPTESSPSETTPGATEAPAGDAGITFPLSFSDAAEQGVEVAWDERCDTETGNLAVQWFFAPECFAPFEGDNGGETSRGVTAETIKVVLYQGPDDDPIINYLSDAVSVDDTNAEEEQTVRDMLELFQQFYEFYGRTIELEAYVSDGLANDEVTARADAVRIAEDFAPFAVFGGPALTNAFADELAARDVLCVGCGGGTPEWFAERDPYVWTLGISGDQSRDHAREFIAKQLIGGNAEFAGDAAFQAQPRTFGHVWISSTPESEIVANDFVADLTEDGADVAENLPYTLDPATLPSQASQIIAKLKASGVTTVVFATDPIAPRDFTREATIQEYFPEWVLVSPTLSDTTAFARTYDQEQWANAVGVTSNIAARITPENSGYFALYEWFRGTEPPAADTIGIFMPNISLFAAVLQGTGPNLTPETWRDALFASEGTTAAISQPYLSYGDKGIWEQTDYNGVDDATLIWWDPAATGPDEIRKDGTGMYQYVDGGKRYLPGEWPTENKLFDPEGAVAIYDVAPPGEEPPQYPSPAG
jgi:hypothetical protein